MKTRAFSYRKSCSPANGIAANSRTQWIDAAKGLGNLLIVIGHIYSILPHSLAYVYIYSFNVPLFFFISGCAALSVYIKERYLPFTLGKSPALPPPRMARC